MDFSHLPPLPAILRRQPAFRPSRSSLSRAIFSALALITVGSFPLTPRAATLGWNADALSATLAKADKLPPPPAGVTQIAFAELFKMPIGARGIEFSDTARKLEGRTVRMLGFMVHQDQSVPGLMILSPFAVGTDEAEYGLCDDLPASVVFVSVPKYRASAVPFTPGPLLLTGHLELGPHTEADGRVSHVRLNLVGDPADLPANSAP